MIHIQWSGVSCLYFMNITRVIVSIEFSSGMLNLTQMLKRVNSSCTSGSVSASRNQLRGNLSKVSFYILFRLTSTCMYLCIFVYIYRLFYELWFSWIEFHPRSSANVEEAFHLLAQEVNNWIWLQRFSLLPIFKELSRVFPISVQLAQNSSTSI